MTDQDRDTYVKSALALLGYPSDDALLAAVVPQFALIASIAEDLVEADLPIELELAPVFRP